MENNNIMAAKLEQAAAIRTKAAELLGHNAEIVPNGTAYWVKGYVKTTQVDFRPKTPCVLVVVEGEDKKLYRRCFGSPLLKVDLESPIHETPSRVRVPETEAEILEALKKAEATLAAAKNRVELLTAALNKAKAEVETESKKKSSKK